MSNLLVLVAGTTLDYCVKVLLMGSLFPPFFGQEVTHIHTHTHTHPLTNTYLCWLSTGGFSD